MFKKIVIKFLFIFLLLSNYLVKANDIANMEGISEAAGNSAKAAADEAKITAIKKEVFGVF